MNQCLLDSLGRDHSLWWLIFHFGSKFEFSSNSEEPGGLDPERTNRSKD